MNYRIRIIAFYSLLILSTTVKSQTIQFEIVAGNEYLETNIVVTKSFSEQSKFTLLNVTSFDAYYDDDEEDLDNSVVVTQVNYTVWKNIGIGAGVSYNSVSGLAPSVGASYTNFGERHGITIAPGVSFPSNTSSSEASFQIVANLEYTPKLSEKLNLYLASNSLFNYDFEGDNVISFQKLKLGLDYKTLQFGFAANFDQVGPIKITNNNYGFFISNNF